jgi:transcriptional regulator with XRE-family HTH domain
MRLRATLGRHIRETRLALDISQQELARAIGVSRGYVAHIEQGQANASLDLVERAGIALGIDFELLARRPVADRTDAPRDVVHAWCSGYVDRRLRRAGWLTDGEVEIVHARHHGWIDLVAFQPTTRPMLVIEVKTRLDDIGAVERQLGWYERSAGEVAARLGWRPATVSGWLLLLSTGEVEEALRANRDVLATAFPRRAKELGALLQGTPTLPGRGLALIDPAARRRSWLLPSRIDGRRSPPPFSNYAEAARRLTR